MNGLPDEIPTDEDGRPMILLGIGVDEDGFLYLYDRLTDRKVSMMDHVTVQASSNVNGVQRVDVGVHTHPGLVDQDAIEEAREGNGGWTMNEWINAKD